VEFSCIENIKLERKEEKKLKERILNEKAMKQLLRQSQLVKPEPKMVI
jgi:hypothetical protein